MKATILLCLVGTALAAPTKTIEDRQLSNFGSSSGLGALSSLLPSIGNLGSGLGSSSSGGSSLPSFSNIPGLGDLGSLNGIAKRQTIGGGSTTANGVTDNKSCEPLTFIFARGSDELGNMGSVVGPPVATQLKSLTNDKVTVQGVDYTASAEVSINHSMIIRLMTTKQLTDIQSNVQLGANGGPVMAKLVKQALDQCPNTTVVLGGYSQGAMVVHNAANKLSADQVAGAVLFGDPFKTQSVGKLDSSKVKEFCAAGDPVCENGVNVMAHLSYGSDAKDAAQFLVKVAGV